MQTGVLDVGFFVASNVGARGLKRRKLWTEDLVLAMPTGHPFAALESVPVHALDGQPLLVNSPESSPEMAAYLRELFRRTNVQPVPVVNLGVRMYSFAGIMHLIAEGEGLFLIVRSFQDVGHAGVTFRPLRDPTPGLPMWMVWRKALPESMQGALEQAFSEDR